MSSHGQTRHGSELFIKKLREFPEKHGNTFNVYFKIIIEATLLAMVGMIVWYQSIQVKNFHEVFINREKDIAAIKRSFHVKMELLEEVAKKTGVDDAIIRRIREDDPFADPSTKNIVAKDPFAAILKSERVK